MKPLVRITISILFTSICAICVASGDCATPINYSRSTASRAGVAVVSGHLVVLGTNQSFLPRGFTSIGVVYPTQYASKLCVGPGVKPGSRIGDVLQETQTALIASPLPGLRYNASFQAMVQDWHANSVRLQVSQGALEYEYENGLSAYTDMVRSAIAQARAAGLIVFIAMQSETYGCTPYENGALQRLPDVHTQHSWAQLLNSRPSGPPSDHGTALRPIASDKGILLEIFNEPNTSTACNTGLPYPEANWTDWATGCGTEPNQGMLPLAQYVRRLAPNNVLVIDGDRSAGTFAGFVVPSGMPSNLAYTVHPYDYVKGSVSASMNFWDTLFGEFEQSGHAVIVTEWNEAFGCRSDPNQAITDEFLQSYLPGHSIGMVGYAWDAPYWTSGYLVNSYAYPGNTPNYNVVDPNSSGCPQDGGNELLQEFTTQATQYRWP